MVNVGKKISDICNEMASYLNGGFEHIFEQMNKSIRYYVMPRNILFKYLFIVSSFVNFDFNGKLHLFMVLKIVKFIDFQNKEKYKSIKCFHLIKTEMVIEIIIPV